ncbi:MAG: hypothetical protein JST50_01445 [Bacteroidetes bacterium]|jgi:hypothetical protein|nr:hypothetical protein [Bacteroidota bacterium]
MMNPSNILLTNALSGSNELLTNLLTDPAIPADQKEQIKRRIGLNTVAISIAKIQEDNHA